MDNDKWVWFHAHTLLNKGWHLNFTYFNLSSKTNKIGKIYSLEHTYIPKIFFMPQDVGHHFFGGLCIYVIPDHCCKTMPSNNDLRLFLQ